MNQRRQGHSAVRASFVSGHAEQIHKSRTRTKQMGLGGTCFLLQNVQSKLQRTFGHRVKLKTKRLKLPGHMKGNLVHMTSNEIEWTLDTTSRGAHALDFQGILLTSKCWKALDFGPALAFFLSILWVTPLSPMFLHTIDTSAAAKLLQSCLTL